MPRGALSRRLFTLVVGAALLGSISQCRSKAKPSENTADAPSAAQSAEPPRPLVVFAAASLRDVFGPLGKSFEAAYPGTVVTFHFAGTQELRTQLEQGAKADVFASADQRHMKALLDAQLVVHPRIFAHNEPVLVVSKEAAGTVQSFADLPKATRVVVGAPEVPIGAYTRQILELAGRKLGAEFLTQVEAHVVSRELNVRQVLTKVSLGEAQAGIVYRSDVASAKGTVSVVAIPSELNVVADYPIAFVAASKEPEFASEFMNLVTSPKGQAALRAAGFSLDSGSAPKP